MNILQAQTDRADDETCFEGTHISSSDSFLSALRAIVWKAESTFRSSFADTSKYGMFPLPLHHCLAFFSVTCKPLNRC